MEKRLTTIVIPTQEGDLDILTNANTTEEEAPTAVTMKRTLDMKVT